MAYTQLGAMAEGSIVKIRENGVLVDFCVAKQDYEPELNGTGRVLVVRKDCYDQRQWHSSLANAYATSDIDAWLNRSYVNLLDADILAAMGTTKFYYTPGLNDYSKAILERPVFLLSGTELGQTNARLNIEGTALGVADILKIARLNGVSTGQWTRSPKVDAAYFAWQVNSSGSINDINCFNESGSRPTFTLPSFLCVTDDGEITTNTAPDAPSDLKKYTKMGSKAVGSIVKLRIDGVATDFIVVHQGLPGSMYDASCDGTWMLSKDCLEERRWHSSNVNDYANSTIHSYLNSTFLDLLDKDIQAQIKQVKLPYRAGSGCDTTVTSGANGLPAKIFLLSGTEVSMAHSYIPVMGAELSYFAGCADTREDTKRVATLNGSASDWWLRCPCCNLDYGKELAQRVHDNGAWINNGRCSDYWAIRPALILDSALLVSDDGTVTANVAPTTSTGISIPGSIRGGSTITILWGASTDAEGNLEGYTVERSTDGGSTWTQIYQGDALSTTNTVPIGTETVMYRVRAYDSEGLYSSWRTSGQVTVINNTAPSAPASIAVPVTVLGGSTLDIIWETSADKDGNLAGYSLERQVDGGGWETVYRGAAANYTDAITRGWTSVAYRVRAYDSYDAYSGYTLSATRSVNNNIAPVITCAMESGSDLGVQNEDFSVDYSASDADGDAVTITEVIDNEVVRRFTAGAGQEYTFDVTGETYMRLLNGTHTLTITANDGQVDAVHKLTFTKEITAASVTLKTPIEADDRITICVLSVTGSIPMDAHYRVVVTNNANDEEPVWEDCTSEVRSGANHIFANETAVNGFAFNFRVEVERGESGQGGYINSVQGGFQ